VLNKLPSRIANKILPEPMAGCWFWTGHVNAGGYGWCTPHDAAGTTKKAHRIVYALLRGRVADGMDLDHLCRVRCCVNPDHLEPVTRSVNLKRSPLIGRTTPRRTVCFNGLHAMTPENVYVGTDGRKCRACIKAYGASRDRTADIARNRERLRAVGAAKRLAAKQVQS
jgi:hypothetical protein